jgi:hypothetical protein
MSGVIPRCASREVELAFVSELCHMSLKLRFKECPEFARRTWLMLYILPAGSRR